MAKPDVSPDGTIGIAAGIAPNGAFEVSIRHRGKSLIDPSPAGILLADHPFGPLVETGRTRLIAALGCPGERISAREKGPRGRAVILETAACDDGAAFRVIVPGHPSEGVWRVTGESTRFVTARNDACLGVRHEKFFNSHEGDYKPVRLRTLKHDDLYDLPLTCATGREGETYALTESNIENYAAAYLTGTVSGNAVSVRLTPRPDDDRLAVVLPAGEKITTPWRIVMIADRPERLVENRMVQRLAAPSRIADTTWIIPGKAAWGWWSGLLAPDVPNAGHNMATYRRYIDFAGRMRLRYYVIDQGWASKPSGPGQPADVLTPAEGINVPELVEYARRRGVHIWLWTDWTSLDGRMDAVLARWQGWGVAGMKVDFIYRQDQAVVGFYHRLLATAARHRILVNMHAAFVPRGLETTYPNFLTQEGAMGNEYNRWRRKVTAGYDVRAAYTRATIGPMDYTPGGFRNVTPAAFSPKAPAPEVMTTRAHQLALFVLYPSPLTSLADAPVAYRSADGRWAPGVAFIQQVPTTWDETHGIAGAMGEWIAVARRNGERWYVGAITDSAARTVTLPLVFPKNGRWKVRAWIDGKTPSALGDRTGKVRAGTRLGVPIAANGGAALVFERP
ncbi:alpha-glucosidase [Sphingomonas sp. PvP055]|uniref:glycoside hydrolase family 97 protein n=1 Tax=Sphingomonas sp. PvP055 TaxID=3156391 RepID=UPI003391ED05